MNNEYNNLISFGNFRLDAEKKVLWFANEPVNLALKEVELLCVLTENGGEVVTKDELLNKVWANSFVEESNLSRHIYRLRKTFAEFGESGDLIQTVPRRGYRFTGEVFGNNSDDLIIEKHSFSRTLIEELEDSAEPNLKIVTQTSTRKRNRLWLPIAICLVMLTSGFGYYVFNSTKSVSAQPINSIAVLPLKSLDNENNKALNLGFADALITNLGKLDEVKILSTNAISHFADEPQEPTEIGKNLAVDAIIDGTLQRANGKYRVTLRLIRTNDGKQIWHNSFDKPEAEIFQLQDLMAMQTAQALSVTLKDRAKPLTENQDAYQFYLQGLYLFRRRETGKSTVFFKKAIELDSKFAKAWSVLAGAYAMGDAMPEAEATVNKALELDPNLAEAHAVRGFVKIFLDWDWNEAEKSLNRAVELDPNSVEAHHWRGILYQIRGRFSEAKAELNRALELDPASANMISDLGHINHFAGEFEKAEELYKKAESMELNIALNRLIPLYEKQGREAETFEALLKLIRLQQGPQENRKYIDSLVKEYEKGRLKGAFRFRLNDTIKWLATGKSPRTQVASHWYAMAILHTQLGEKEKAIASLNRALEIRLPYETINFTFPFVAFDPTFDEIRDEPGFREVWRKLNLP